MLASSRLGTPPSSCFASDLNTNLSPITFLSLFRANSVISDPDKFNILPASAQLPSMMYCSRLTGCFM